MLCPNCCDNNVTAVGDSHYVCNNPKCIDKNGKRIQFRIVEDDRIHFPYNQIFVGRGKHEFYRKPYLQLDNVGLTEIAK